MFCFSSFTSSQLQSSVAAAAIPIVGVRPDGLMREALVTTLYLHRLRIVDPQHLQAGKHAS